ncbi:sulfatase-like hydrolase/transferase [Thalassoglobus sp.]|uniref:sulfatase-like hydrolase/transferase n=1 Tax=Thalassoglobus sp. TaxID=2795869 RepID=UPI003AA8F73E
MSHWLIAVVISFSLFAHARAEEQPNIVFIFIDDMGYGDLSCFHHLGADGWDSETISRYPKTPNIDELASEGLRLTNFYVASPICSPSRVGCTTGQFPSRHLINSYLNSREKNKARGMADFLNPDAPAIARAFQQHGYATAHFGKWHQGGGRDVDDAPLPSAYGFDESLVSFEGLGDRILPPGGLSEQSAKLKRGKIEHVEKHEQTPIYVDRSIDFIERHQDQPFYLHLWLNDVHDAHNPAPGEAEKFTEQTDNVNEQKFFAVLVEMDKQIGRLIQRIDKLGLDKKTLIVLTSDNGPTAWARYYRRQKVDPAGSTAGFRGRKWSLYEGGIRMPFIARWPGKIEANSVNQDLILSTVDFFPTFATLAGIDLKETLNIDPKTYFDGEDLSQQLLNNEGQRTKPLLWEYGRDESYLRPGLKRDQSPNLALRDGQWKLLINDDGSRVELYDFRQSNREMQNVAKQHPTVTKKLSEQLLEWRRALPVRTD